MVEEMLSSPVSILFGSEHAMWLELILFVYSVKLVVVLF